jgi:hypothetical protein
LRAANFERLQSNFTRAAELLKEAERIDTATLFSAQRFYQQANLDASKQSYAAAVANARKAIAFLDQAEAARPLAAEHKPMRPDLQELITNGGRLKPSPAR